MEEKGVGSSDSDAGEGHHSGTGLGLAIAKAICGFHRWEISYSHDEGRHMFSAGAHPSSSHVNC